MANVTQPIYDNGLSGAVAFRHPTGQLAYSDVYIKGTVLYAGAVESSSINLGGAQLLQPLPPVRPYSLRLPQEPGQPGNYLRLGPFNNLEWINPSAQVLEKDVTTLDGAEPYSVMCFNQFSAITTYPGLLFNGSTLVLSGLVNGLAVISGGALGTLSGTSDQYIAANSSLRTFTSDVRSTGLASLSTSSSAVVVSGDTILSGIGKLQAQITGHSQRFTSEQLTYSSSASVSFSASSARVITIRITADNQAVSALLPSSPLLGEWFEVQNWSDEGTINRQVIVRNPSNTQTLATLEPGYLATFYPGRVGTTGTSIGWCIGEPAKMLNGYN